MKGFIKNTMIVTGRDAEMFGVLDNTIVSCCVQGEDGNNYRLVNHEEFNQESLLKENHKVEFDFIKDFVFLDNKINKIINLKLLSDTSLLQGSIEWFNKSDGHGFILDENNNSYYFSENDVINNEKLEEIHKRENEIKDRLIQTIEFKKENTSKGLSATKIKIFKKHNQEFGVSVNPNVRYYF